MLYLQIILKLQGTQYTIQCMMTLYGWKNLVILSFIGMLQVKLYFFILQLQ